MFEARAARVVAKIVASKSRVGLHGEGRGDGASAIAGPRAHVGPDAILSEAVLKEERRLAAEAFEGVAQEATCAWSAVAGAGARPEVLWVCAVGVLCFARVARGVAVALVAGELVAAAVRVGVARAAAAATLCMFIAEARGEKQAMEARASAVSRQQDGRACLRPAGGCEKSG